MRITPREHRYVAVLIAMLAGVTMPGSSSMAQSPTALTDLATGVALGTQPLTVALPPQPAMPRAFAEARRGPPRPAAASTSRHWRSKGSKAP